MRENTSWLCRDTAERERMLDMDARLQPLRTLGFGVITIGVLLSSPWLGAVSTLVAVAAALVGAVVVGLLDGRAFFYHRTRTAERPEYWVFGGWLASLVVVAVLVAVTESANAVTLAWFAVPVSTLSARFPARVTVVGLGLALCVMVTVALMVHGAEAGEYPPRIILPAVLVITVTLLSTAAMSSDVEHRASAVVDPLTGCLNRAALQHRVEELSQQTVYSLQPVALVIGDVDHFKHVNDNHGHGVGDAVLVDVAYALRKQLGAYDAVYRVGGEEFVVVLPGKTRAAAWAMAESLRRAVEDRPMGPRLSVTMSFGVGASESGSPFDFRAVQEEADHALYDAKRLGRNRVAGRHPVVGVAA